MPAGSGSGAGTCYYSVIFRSEDSPRPHDSLESTKALCTEADLACPSTSAFKVCTTAETRQGRAWRACTELVEILPIVSTLSCEFIGSKGTGLRALSRDSPEIR